MNYQITLKCPKGFKGDEFVPMYLDQLICGLSTKRSEIVNGTLFLATFLFDWVGRVTFNHG